MKYFPLLLLLIAFNANAQFPDKPDNYVTDRADLLKDWEKGLLNKKLRKFEDSTSNQLFIFIDRRYHGGSIEEYSRKIFNTWGIGQKEKNNGILIAIFIDDREYRIQVGLGLEQALPSQLTLGIQDDHMRSHFREYGYYKGIDAGVDQLIYYSKHEYTPPGPYEKFLIHLIVMYSLVLIMFVINLLSLKKWNNQPKRRQKYLTLNIVFALFPLITFVITPLFTEDQSLPILLPGILSGLALIILCTVVNDKGEVRYDNEPEDSYQRRMYDRRSESSDSNDSFDGGGGGSSGSGGSSSSW